MHDIQSIKSKFNEGIQFFKQELNKIRTGRATPALVEHLSIEAYGVKSPLMQIASISAPDPKTIIIQPWDKGLLKDIEKGISASDIQIQPIIEGTIIRLSLPALTEENRQKMVKLVQQRAEACRISLRQIREKAREELTREKSDGRITEDVVFKTHKLIDDSIKECQEIIKQIVEKKEHEIITL